MLQDFGFDAGIWSGSARTAIGVEAKFILQCLWRISFVKGNYSQPGCRVGMARRQCFDDDAVTASCWEPTERRFSNRNFSQHLLTARLRYAGGRVHQFQWRSPRASGSPLGSNNRAMPTAGQARALMESTLRVLVGHRSAQS
jgi:hypothetical protein